MAFPYLVYVCFLKREQRQNILALTSRQEMRHFGNCSQALTPTLLLTNISTLMSLLTEEHAEQSDNGDQNETPDHSH